MMLGMITSCVDSPEVTERLVLEGWIESGENPVVMLSLPYHPGDQQTPAEDLIAHPAKVVISDGEESWPLYGMIDKNYFPPFIYTTPNMYGEVGKRYTIRADFRGMYVEGSSTLLANNLKPQLSVKESATRPDCRSLMLTVDEMPPEREYFTIFVRSLGEQKRSLPAFMGFFKTDPDDKGLEIPVIRPKNKMDTTEYIPEFRVGERVEVKVCRLDKEAYQYWLDFQNAISVGGSNLVASSYELHTNLTGGIGYFFAYGVAKSTITIK